MIEYDFPAAVEREGRALAAAAAAGPGRPVGSYPGWTVMDLVAHTGSVHRWVERLVASRALEPPQRHPQPERDPVRLLDWFESGLLGLVDTLRLTDPSLPVWTMATDRTAGFWRRRMSHETAAHRWDAEDAVGEARPIEAAIAATGIPETLEIHVVRPLAGAAVDGRGQRLALHSTDVTGDWVVQLLPDRVVVEDVPGSYDAVIAGTASSVWLALMSRAGAPIEITGDNSVLDAFWRALRLADPPDF